MNGFDQQFSFFFNIEVGAWKEWSWGLLLFQLPTQKDREREILLLPFHFFYKLFLHIIERMPLFQKKKKF